MAEVVALPDEAILAGVAKGDAGRIEELGNLLREESNRTVYVSALAPLAELLRAGTDVRVAGQAARALANLCFDNAPNRTALSQKAEAVAFLCQPHEDVALQRSATGCLANLLSQDDEAGEAVARAGAVEALVRAVPTQTALACRGLSNASQRTEWSERAAGAGAAEALLASGAEEAQGALEGLLGAESVALRVAKDEKAVARLAELGWDEALLALCSKDAAAAVLAESEASWRALDAFPRCQGLVAGAEAGAARALQDAPRLLQLLRREAAVPGEPEDKAKARADARSGALLALGNAARSDEAVRAVMGLPEVLPTLLELLRGSTGDQHLATGLLGNLAVPAESRPALAAAGAGRAAAECLAKSLNAHVMMNAAVFLRRLSLHEQTRRQVAAELPTLLEQRQRLNQPEHARVALELGRVAALCYAEDVALSEDGEKALLDMLGADWSVLRMEACRGCALLAAKCTPTLIARLLAVLQDAESDGPLRHAAAVALHRAAPANPDLRAALQKVGIDPDAPEGSPYPTWASKF